jgi:hypothetical protein
VLVSGGATSAHAASREQALERSREFISEVGDSTPALLVDR